MAARSWRRSMPPEPSRRSGFMVIGFFIEFRHRVLRLILRCARPRGCGKIDAATVAGYYGSDSAGTFVTCLGVLTAAEHRLCRLHAGDAGRHGNSRLPRGAVSRLAVARDRDGPAGQHAGRGRATIPTPAARPTTDLNARMATRVRPRRANGNGQPQGMFDSRNCCTKCFSIPGLYLLFGGIVIGYVSRLQGEKRHRARRLSVRRPVPGRAVPVPAGNGHDGLQAAARFENGRLAIHRLCARSRRISSPRSALPSAHGYSMFLGKPFDMGTYASVLRCCVRAASYIAVPAVQRLAIPEASPTLPLAASLGLTFSYNVTIGIPIYIMIAKAVIEQLSRWRGRRPPPCDNSTARIEFAPFAVLRRAECGRGTGQSSLPLTAPGRYNLAQQLVATFPRQRVVMDKELTDRAEAIQQRIVQLRDSL